MADEQPDIRLDIVDKFYNGIDKLIDKLFEEDNISFGEIEFGFLKMNEKIMQQKITLMYHYLKNEGEGHSQTTEVDKVPEKEKPDGMYG